MEGIFSDWQARGITVVPDILASGGGVTVSYLEWVQDLYSFFWDPENVRTQLQRTIRRSYADVEATARLFQKLEKTLLPVFRDVRL